VSGIMEGDLLDPGNADSLSVGGRRSPMTRGARSPRSQSPAKPGNLVFCSCKRQCFWLLF
jgi:hypothetical protein